MNINTFNFDIFRLNVIKRLIYINFFYLSFKAFINLFKRFFAKFIIINNRNRKRI